MPHIFIIFFVAVWASGASAQEGPTRVIDGDTLDIVGERIRLHGIDAPEKDQTCTIDDQEWECGVAAWGYLVQLLAGQFVTCDPKDIDQYCRTVAACFVGGQDINATTARVISVPIAKRVRPRGAGPVGHTSINKNPGV